MGLEIEAGSIVIYISSCVDFNEILMNPHH